MASSKHLIITVHYVEKLEQSSKEEEEKKLIANGINS